MVAFPPLEASSQKRNPILLGSGSTTQALTTDDVQRLLVIIPDGTRAAPIPLLFRLLYAQLRQRVARLDYLSALGTHPPMKDESIARLVGVGRAYANGKHMEVSLIDTAGQGHTPHCFAGSQSDRGIEEIGRARLLSA